MIKYFLFLIILLVFPTASYAAEVTINFDVNKSYGTVNQYFGVKIPSNLDVDANYLKQFFNKGHVYLKIDNPTTNLLTNNNFQALSSSFTWYFSFSQNDSIRSFLDAFFSRYNQEAVVEIKNYDGNFITALKNQYPQIKIHAPQFVFWPRDQASNILSQTPPPTLEALSLRTEEGDIGDFFPRFKLMFDTFFDASLDIAGGSGIKINYPSETKLALSDIVIGETDPTKSSAFAAGLISAAIVTSVQSQSSSNNAPIKYIIGGNFLEKSEPGKNILKYSADFIASKPNIIWPMAFTQNGDPYDNPFMPESNAKPIIGVIGKGSEGIFMILANASGDTVTANLNQDIGLQNLKFYSTIKGKGTFSSPTQISFAPYETIVASTSIDDTSSYTPPSPTATAIPPTPTTVSYKQPSPTTVSKKIQPSPSAPSIQKQLPLNQNQQPKLPSETIEKKQVTFNVKIINPYRPYRKIAKVNLIVGNNEVNITKLNQTFSLSIPNKPTPFNIEVITLDNFTFQKKGSVDFQHPNNIAVTLGTPIFLFGKNLLETIFDKVDLINNLIQTLDQPFKKLGPNLQ